MPPWRRAAARSRCRRAPPRPEPEAATSRRSGLQSSTTPRAAGCAATRRISLSCHSLPAPWTYDHATLFYALRRSFRPRRKRGRACNTCRLPRILTRRLHRARSESERPEASACAPRRWLSAGSVPRDRLLRPPSRRPRRRWPSRCRNEARRKKYDSADFQIEVAGPTSCTFTGQSLLVFYGRKVDMNRQVEKAMSARN